MLLQWNHLINGYVRGLDDDGLASELPFVSSLLYYAITALLGRALRFAIRVRLKNDVLLRRLLFDFVTTFQLMAMSLENGQLRKHYGDVAYIAILLATGVWSYYTIDDGLANPCGCIVDVMKGQYGHSQAILRCFVQLAGGLLSYQYARLFWTLGLTDSHLERSSIVFCRSDLRVASLMGFAIEFSATFVNTLICFNTFSSFKHSENLSKCLFGSYLTLFGMYMYLIISMTCIFLDCLI